MAAIELTREELDQVYEALNRVKGFLKRREQMLAALELADKPRDYSPLMWKVFEAEKLIAEKVGAAHNEEVQRADDALNLRG